MRKADNLPPSCAVVTKSENLNFLEPSGSVLACNGIAFLYEIDWINKRKYLMLEKLVTGGWGGGTLAVVFKHRPLFVLCSLSASFTWDLLSSSLTSINLN